MEQRIEIDRLEQAVNIFGSFDENIRLLEQEFSVTVVNREGELRVSGEPEDTMLACKAIQALLTLSSKGETIGVIADAREKLRQAGQPQPGSMGRSSSLYFSFLMLMEPSQV